jgi:hypothetical protein
MNTVSVVAGVVVVGFAAFLIGLAVVCACDRTRAERFLRAFASSARTHYTEQALRLVVGLSIVRFSEFMWLSEAFRIFGWVVVGSTSMLLVIPWRWHHAFAARVMPHVYRRLGLFALASAALGACVVLAVFRGVFGSF